jgi:hypothetical protein
MFEKIMNRYLLSDDERVSVQSDLDKLVVLLKRARTALEGATLSLAQRESCKKAVPVLEEKIKRLNEKLMADRLLRNCDECNIPRHFQDRPR